MGARETAVIATPWSPTFGWRILIISGLLSAIEGLNPRMLFRLRRDLHTDLRDIPSLANFLIFGAILNTGTSAILGNLLVVAHPAGVWINWREVFVWWIADFTAALLLATPILAFGSTFMRRLRGESDHRTLANALQIVVAVILLVRASLSGFKSATTTWSTSAERARSHAITEPMSPEPSTAVFISECAKLWRF